VTGRPVGDLAVCVRSWEGTKINSLLQRVTRVLRPDWVPDCEAKHTPASGAEIKNAWNDTAAPK
jgi:hypothetical protein